MRIFFIGLLCLLLCLASCGNPGKYRAAVKLHDKYGFIDETGDFVVDPDFDIVWAYVHGTAVVKHNGKFGLIDKMGDWVVDAEYDSMRPFNADFFFFKKDSAFGLMEHGTGRIVLPAAYEMVYDYTDELIVVQKGRALGVINAKGELACPPVLQDLKEKYGPLAVVVQSDTSDEMQMLLSIIDGGAVKLGFMNSQGEVVIPCRYDEVFDDVQHGYYYPFIRAEQYANDSVIGDVPIMVGKFGIVDTAGKILTEPLFDEMPVYGDGMFRVRIGEKYGYADIDGKVVIAPRWEFAVAFSEGKAIVSDNGNSSIIDKSGKEIATNLGAGAGMYRFFNNRMRCRSNDGLYGFMDATGTRVIPPTYETADDFVNGVAIVSKDNKYGLIDTNGTILVAPEFEFLYSLGDDLYKVKDAGGNTGVIDRHGQVVIERAYDDVFHLQKNYLMVEKDYLSGCFNLSGKLLYPAISPLQLFFIEGKSIVYNETTCGMIDSTGAYIVKAEYDSIGYFYNGYTTMTKNGVYGAIDSTGKVIIEAKYTTLQPFMNGFAVFRHKGKFGYVNLQGEEIIPAQFDDAGILVDPDRRTFY